MATSPILLDSSIRVVVLQFTLDIGKMPPFLSSKWRRTAERPDEYRARWERNQISSGHVLLPDSSDIYANIFPAALDAKYKLGRISIQRRYSGKKPEGYESVLFTFTHLDWAKPKPNFLPASLGLLAGLTAMLDANSWRLKVYRNGFRMDGQVVPGAYKLAFNFDKQCPVTEHPPARCLVLKESEIVLA